MSLGVSKEVSIHRRQQSSEISGSFGRHRDGQEVLRLPVAQLFHRVIGGRALGTAVPAPGRTGSPVQIQP
jgi:hypothetical protein